MSVKIVNFKEGQSVEVDLAGGGLAIAKVVSVEDPALLTVQNKLGTSFKVGRQCARVAEKKKKSKLKGRAKK